MYFLSNLALSCGGGAIFSGLGVFIFYPAGPRRKNCLESSAKQLEVPLPWETLSFLGFGPEKRDGTLCDELAFPYLDTIWVRPSRKRPNISNGNNIPCTNSTASKCHRSGEKLTVLPWHCCPPQRQEHFAVLDPYRQFSCFMLKKLT